MASRSLVVVFFLFLNVGLVHGDWLRFRGPNGAAVSEEDSKLPAKWTESDVAWRTKLPGPGVSSPIIVGDKVFVTCYSGYGEDRQAPGRMEDLKRHLVCVNAKTGAVVWDKSVKATLPEDPYSGMGVPSHGYASHTPVSDGERGLCLLRKVGRFGF